MKLRIVAKKIRKYGELGKIPMGASMRVYHENPDTDSSVSSASESSAGETNSDVNDSDDDGGARAKSPQKRVTKELLRTNELVYQPEYSKVVRQSTTNLKSSDSSSNSSDRKKKKVA